MVYGVGLADIFYNYGSTKDYMDFGGLILLWISSTIFKGTTLVLVSKELGL